MSAAADPQQLDFSRRLVLPTLDEWVRAYLRMGRFRQNLKEAFRVRVALQKAAEDGFLTWHFCHGDPPEEWSQWCLANRHPPVTRLLKLKYATLSCALADLDDLSGPFASLPFAALEPVARVVGGFGVKGKGGWSVGASHVHAGGVLIDDSREAAAALVDVLHENLVWKEAADE